MSFSKAFLGASIEDSITNTVFVHIVLSPELQQLSKRVKMVHILEADNPALGSWSYHSKLCHLLWPSPFLTWMDTNVFIADGGKIRK